MSPAGEVVDVELLRDGRAVFDLSRLLDYAKSIGAYHLDDYLLANACDQLVYLGVLQPVRLGPDPSVVDLTAANDEGMGVVIDLRRADCASSTPRPGPRAGSGARLSGFDDHA